MTKPTSQIANHKDEPQRVILPIPDRPYTNLITYDANHDSYCNRYRIAARSSSPLDSSTGNMGFRCTKDVD
jgi:hypothetical protein